MKTYTLQIHIFNPILQHIRLLTYNVPIQAEPENLEDVINTYLSTKLKAQDLMAGNDILISTCIGPLDKPTTLVTTYRSVNKVLCKIIDE